MAITERIAGLGVVVEPRPAGTLTETGLLKTRKGEILARHGTDSGAREGSDIDMQVQAANDQMAELEAMRDQPELKKRGRKKAVKQQAAAQPSDTVEATITVEGFGGIPSQYDQVCIGNDVAMLGLTPRSFIPQAAAVLDGKPTQVLRLSVAPDRRYVYFGSQVTDKRGVTNLILVELK